MSAVINQKRLIKTFLELVKIDSISLKEGKISLFLKKKLKKLGLRVKEDNTARKIGGESGNITAVLKSNLKKKTSRIMFNSHLDTVIPGIKIKPRIKGDLISSDGNTILAADDKAGIAILLEAIKIIKGKNLGHPELIFVFTVAEEIGILGAKNLKRKLIKADFGYVLDSHGEISNIINQAPTQDTLDIKIVGKAAHAGMCPEKGISAIKVAGEAISKIKIGRIDKETTANIGVIKGGHATNIITEEVSIKGEARSLKIKKLDKTVSRIKNVFQKTADKHKAKLYFSKKREYDSFFVSRQKKPIKLVLKALKEMNLKGRILSTGGGSDANIFNSMGIPSVILSAGYEKPHAKDEYIKIKRMVQAVRLILNIINAQVN